jgi:flavin-dependent dehydrogenase
MAAIEAARRGVEDILIVDRSDFPRTKPCAGGIAPSAESFLRSSGYEAFLDLEPSGLMSSIRFIGPDGTENITSSSLKARVINRRIFDTALLERARELGARFLPGFTLRDLILDETNTVRGISDGERKIHSDLLILATGGHNRELREKYFPDRRPLRVMTSRMAWYRGFELPEGRMEMIFDRDLLPHYGWVFPEGEGVVNIGICLFQDRLQGKTIIQAYDDFIEKYYSERIRAATQVGQSLSYPINTSSSVGSLYRPGMMLAGEAGRLCDPATAEGISYALESGYLAARTAERVLSGDRPDYSHLVRYQRDCRRSFSLRLRLSSLFRFFVTTRAFSALVRFGSTPAGKKIMDALMPT